MNFVFDNSVAMMWLLPKSNPRGVALATKALHRLIDEGARVPSIWPIEATNVISKSLHRSRITESQAQTFIALLEHLDITVDQQANLSAFQDTLTLARRYGLSSYDAAYLELALRAELPLATLDTALIAAAQQAGVTMIA